MTGSILITGGTGYFGRAFARRVLDGNLSERVCIYSRGEYQQHLMRAAFGDDSRLRFFVGDVRDKDRLYRAMDGVDTVIHAAALKRVETGEYNPDELVKTNIGGALNLIEAALNPRLPRNVVALSTDKAVAPCNAYGTSKLMAEKLFLAANNTRGSCGPKFAVARYGNIAGSTGSVIPTWRQLLADGKRLQITDPQCTRFWMRIDEAVDLVLRAIGQESLIVPTLPAYRLGDLAIAMGGETEIVGMREGEKLHEQMSDTQFSNLARRMSVEDLREALLYV